MTTELNVGDHGYSLAVPNASESEDRPQSTTSLSKPSTPTPGEDSKERKGKTRTKSPSFFKMLVSRGIRKVSTHELEDADGSKRTDSSSFSDNDDPV